MSDEVEDPPPAAPAEPAPPVPITWGALAELPGGQLIKFPDGPTALAHPAVPSSARIWVSRSHFIGNAHAQDYPEHAACRLPEPADPEALSDVNSAPALKGRLFDALLDRAWTPAEASINLGVQAKESKMARKAAGKNGVGKVKAPKAPRPEGSATRSRVSKEATIQVLAAENPKRKGSAAFDRFKLYKDGMTVADFLKKGGKSIDLGYDAKAGYISVNG